MHWNPHPSNARNPFDARDTRDNSNFRHTRKPRSCRTDTKFTSQPDRVHTGNRHPGKQHSDRLRLQRERVRGYHLGRNYAERHDTKWRWNRWRRLRRNDTGRHHAELHDTRRHDTRRDDTEGRNNTGRGNHSGRGDDAGGRRRHAHPGAGLAGAARQRGRRDGPDGRAAPGQAELGYDVTDWTWLCACRSGRQSRKKAVPISAPSRFRSL